MADFPTARHVALTVTDLEISSSWYERLTGLKPVLVEHVPAVRDHHQGYTHAVFVLSDGFMLALHAHGATDPNHSFDEFRPGLDHISFACADRNEVERWQERLEELGIKHGGIAEDANGFGLSFRDPDGVALEFWTPSPQLSPANG